MHDSGEGAALRLQMSSQTGKALMTVLSSAHASSCCNGRTSHGISTGS